VRADLAPRQLFGSTGDLVRAALAAQPPVTRAAAARATEPRERARPVSTRRRKAG
jgi:hypothetical protein